MKTLFTVALLTAGLQALNLGLNDGNTTANTVSTLAVAGASTDSKVDAAITNTPAVSKAD